MWIGKRWGNWVSRPLVRRTACLLIRSTMRCSRRAWWPRSTWLAGVVPSAQAREATRVVIDADPDGWVVRPGRQPEVYARFYESRRVRLRPATHLTRISM